MRKLVNGTPHDFPESRAEVVEDGNLLRVRTTTGWKTAAKVTSGNKTLISFAGKQYEVEEIRRRGREGPSQSSGKIRSLTPGLVVQVNVQSGDEVTKDQTLMVIEAMKTQAPVIAPHPGRIEILLVSVGQQIKANELLAILAQ
jgi:biotin carboxyl carrier protein